MAYQPPKLCDAVLCVRTEKPLNMPSGEADRLIVAMGFFRKGFPTWRMVKEAELERR